MYPENHTSTPQLVFICGAQRSGTTLLQTILANALGAPLLPEAHLLCDILESYSRAKAAWHKTCFFYSQPGELHGFFRSFALQHLSDVTQAAEPTSTLVLKDPNLIRVLPEMQEIFPTSHRIACIRDPRDIVASFLKIGQRELRGERPTRLQRRDISFIAKKILNAYGAVLASLPEDLYWVRYEELASEPHVVLSNIAERFSLKLSPESLKRLRWLPANARHDQAWISDLEEREISTTSIGSFYSLMTYREVALVEKICEPIFERFGYKKVEPPPEEGRAEVVLRRLLRLRGAHEMTPAQLQELMGRTQQS